MGDLMSINPCMEIVLEDYMTCATRPSPSQEKDADDRRKREYIFHEDIKEWCRLYGDAFVIL